MISYRPTPKLAAGRTGFKAAMAAMTLAAVIGTSAFAPPATTAPSAAAQHVTVAAATAEISSGGRRES